MGRYLGPKEKIERRIGEKLFLKGERSHSPKSAVVKKPYPPGIHGQKRQRRVSEYGLQLRAKQKVRNIYRLMEKQFKASVKRAITVGDEPYSAIVTALERRLDNVVFRLGFAQSRDQARQLVSHGHITVNKRRVTIPSYEVRVGDTIAIREGSKRSSFFSSLMPEWLKNQTHPEWLTFDGAATEGKVTGQPTLEESGLKGEDLQSIIEYYSR